MLSVTELKRPSPQRDETTPIATAPSRQDLRQDSAIPGCRTDDSRVSEATQARRDGRQRHASGESAHQSGANG